MSYKNDWNACQKVLKDFFGGGEGVGDSFQVILFF